MLSCYMFSESGVEDVLAWSRGRCFRGGIQDESQVKIILLLSRKRFFLTVVVLLVFT